MSEDAEPHARPEDTEMPGEAAAPETRKRGRPTGSRDKVPRKKTIHVREEPLGPPAAAASEEAGHTSKPAASGARASKPAAPDEPTEQLARPSSPPEAAPEAVAQRAQPQSPGAMLRAAQEMMLTAKHAKGQARREWLQDVYTSRLAMRT